MIKRSALIGLTLFFVSAGVFPAAASEKTWNGSGDGTSWFDDTNWFPAAAPTAADDVLINSTGASAKVNKTFSAKSITLAGATPSLLTVDPFVSGDIAPDNDTDLALYNRRDGVVTMKGSTGTVVVKGTYKDSEEVLANQPSLVFFIE